MKEHSFKVLGCVSLFGVIRSILVMIHVPGIDHGFEGLCRERTACFDDEIVGLEPACSQYSFDMPRLVNGMHRSRPFTSFIVRYSLVLWVESLKF